MRTVLLFCAVLTLGHSLSISFIEKGVMPSGGIGYMTSTVVGTKIYLFGGLVTDPSVSFYGSSGAYCYDTVTDTWTTLTSFEYERYGMCSATDGEKIWMFGGYDDRYKAYNASTYNIATNSWTWREAPNYMWLCNAAYIPETGKILIALGYAPAWMYDPTTDKYDALPYPLASPLWTGGGSVYYNNTLWIAGDWNDLTVLRTVSSDGQTWGTMASNPNGLILSDMVRVGDVMLTLGGCNDSTEGGFSFDRINMYNITTDTWTTLDEKLPVSVHGAKAVLAGPSIYLFGGVSNPTGTLELIDKFWVVPCVAPDVCSQGCDAATGRCIGDQTPIDATPTAVPMSVPLSAPVKAPVSTSISGFGPKAATSNALITRASWLSVLSLGALSIILA